MIEVRKLDSTESLAEMKRQHIRQATAPLDGMWLCGFVPMATHYGFQDGTKLIGYCAVNDEGYLLQFHVAPTHENLSSDIFASMLRPGSASTPLVKGAFVSTAEPRALSLCLDHFPAFQVNALMYQQAADQDEKDHDPSLVLTKIDASQLSAVVEFAHDSIGAPRDWLGSYYTNLIGRQELFGLWENERLVATGESRGYDELQTEYADLGVIVAESERGKGLATRILRRLARVNASNGLKSICSTEATNRAAQKAIARAGFHAGHRIVQFDA